MAKKTTETRTKFDHEPTRAARLAEDSYTFRPPQGEAATDRERAIVAAYRAGASIEALVLTRHVSPGLLAKLLGLDPEQDAALYERATAAWERLRRERGLTDARLAFSR